MLLSWSSGHNFCLLRTILASNFLFNTLELTVNCAISQHASLCEAYRKPSLGTTKISTNHIFISNKKGYLILLSSTFFKYSSLFNTPNIVSLSCSSKNDKLMISRCFVMILQQPLCQWPICPINIPMIYLHKAKGTFVSEIQDPHSPEVFWKMLL